MQSKWTSFQEACVGTLVGFALSLILQTWVINPLFNLQTHLGENLAIVAIFTLASIIRSYVLRRIFNRKIPYD